MHMDEHDFLAKVELLTQNPTLEGRFRQLLDTTRDFFNLDICSLLFVPDSGTDFHLVSCRTSADQVHEERGQYFCAPRPDAVAAYIANADGAAARDLMVFPRADGEVGVFTRNFRVESVAGADFRPLANLEVRLRLTRSQACGEFTEREIDLIGQLIESIRAAIDAAVREKYTALFNGYAQKLLACLRVGMFIVSPRLEILEQSPLADELLGRLRSYRRADRWLAGASEEFQSKLDQAVFELNADSDLRFRVVDIICMGRGEQYPLVIAKTPVLPPGFTENSFAVFIFSSAEDLFNADRLLSLWQISPAEKRVLTAIARYDNIKKVALELNISPNTAKAQLKSVYKKLGVGSKMRLMKRLNILRNVEALMS
jgi:DNA-binding CsgD family transcriptional regulator